MLKKNGEKRKNNEQHGGKTETIIIWDNLEEMAVTLVHLGVLWRHFGVTLGPLWDHFWYIKLILEHFWISLESSWGHFGHTFGIWGCFWYDHGVVLRAFECMKVNFQKILVFAMNFNDFIRVFHRFVSTLRLHMKHLRHQNRKEEVSEGNMWGILGIKMAKKRCMTVT